MKNSAVATALLAAAIPAAVQGQKCIPRATGERLEAEIKVENVLARAQKLEDIAYSTPGRNRQWQQPGFDLTMDYIQTTLETEAQGYYTIERQPTEFRVAKDPSVVIVNGVDEYPSSAMTTTTGRELLTGSFRGVPIVVVANLGCDASDYPDATGAITLIQRGTCSFELKSQLSKQHGAVAAIVRNAVNSPSFGNGVLGDNIPSLVPTVMMRYEDGIKLLAQVEAAPVSADLDIEYQTLTSYNLIATTNLGNKSDIIMLGAHADSVAEGPGVNDDGSGTVSILETAVQLRKLYPLNAVRFAWWTAEEDGLLGSYYYAQNTPASELAKIRAYLNFDMVGSNNFVYGILDGNGDAYGLEGPTGSSDIEALWEGYFTARGLPFDPSEFSGRSDYAGFIDAGIPSGGLTTGADEVKTAEQVAKYGGIEGEQLDTNYHQPTDTVANMNATALGVMAKGIAYAVGTYANSWEGFPVRTTATPVSKRALRTSGLTPDAESFKLGPLTVWRI